MKGKCKEEFDKWYGLNYEAISLRSIDDYFYIDGFYELPDSMQYGVIEDFFDSVGITIIIDYICMTFEVCVIEDLIDEDYRHDIDADFETRKEARKQAIEKATEIYNNR